MKNKPYVTEEPTSFEKTVLLKGFKILQLHNLKFKNFNKPQKWSPPVFLLSNSLMGVGLYTGRLGGSRYSLGLASSDSSKNICKIIPRLSILRQL